MATELIPSERDEETALAIIQSLEQVRALIPTSDLKEVLQIREQAEMVRAWTQRHKRYQDATIKLSDVSLRASRRAGELLAGSGPKQGRPKKGNTELPLSELGIEKMQSSRWQRIASIPEKQFEDYIAAHINKNEPVRLTEALKLAKANKKRAKRASRPDSGIDPTSVVRDLESLFGSNFQTIYADPPWKYGNQGTRAATDDHYGTMSVDEICALPIREIVADKAVLWLWTTNGFLRESFDVIEAWGFEYKSCMVWCKTQMGIGNYIRVSHEFLMVGSRGKCRPDGKSTKSWLECDRKKHSAKPDEFRTIVENISPEPRIELFAREARPGWTAWGNEIERQKFLEAAN